MNLKLCKSCGLEKLLIDFHLDRTHSDGVRTECKMCRRANTSEEQRQRKVNRAKCWNNANLTKRQNTWLKYKYGITLEEYLRLLEKQHGLCAICDKPETRNNSTRLCVDHNHKTNSVRGLLCHKCNSAIGKLNDDPELLLIASKYLRRKP